MQQNLDMEQLLSEVKKMSISIGQWMKQQMNRELEAEVKSPNNLVTYVDKESERRFVEGLGALLPLAGFVAEEGTGAENVGALNWVIDPLDGTTNFVHGFPVWCTSVALCDGPTPVLGVIYDPNTDECYEARQGAGAFLNGKPIKVSTITSLENSLLATGFPYDDFGREAQYISAFRELMKSTRGIRRLGSAALDMAWTAVGRLEGFYEYGLNPWDVAAGTIIVHEAGGLVSEFSLADNPVFGQDMICSNGKVHHELSATLQKHFV